MRVPHILLLATVFCTALGTALFLLAGADTGRAAEEEPKGHIRIPEPGDLNPEQAQAAYSEALDRLARGYGFAADETAKDYRNWKRFNTTPYRSATHGNRYVNNYANAAARGYGALEPGQALPEGTVLAKDSFTVTQENAVFGAPLFVMEKLKAGTRSKTGDWRYLMIMPDGSVFGDSEGAGAPRVEFCHTCHVTVKDNDHVFFMPEAVRAK